MRTYSSLPLLAALGILSAGSALAVDTSDWKCKTCPYPTGASGSVDVSVGAVSKAAAAFGSYSGMDRDGAFGALGGELSYRGETGYFADLVASDLGLETGALSARTGREGLYALNLGYSELTRRYGDDLLSPFVGIGSAVLTLPAGFPAATSGAMPLASTLQAVNPELTIKRYDVGGTLIGGLNWTYRISLRRDVRDGTRPISGAFFSTASQLIAPVNQTTDQFEISAAYARRGLQANVAYQVSQFRNDDLSLTWTNPFKSVVAGATRGQLSLAPDNQFHQVSGSVGYDITPSIRASINLAAGRMTQDAAYLPATLNASLLPSLGGLPSNSLDGRVDTFDGSARITATVLDGLRLNASYARNVRENRTAVQTYNGVDTEVFIAVPRSNTPFTFKQDRVKLGADYRLKNGLKLSAGVDQDNKERSYSEVVQTRETTVWGRVGAQPRDNVALSLKLAHADRSHSSYGVATWFGTAENELLRRLNLADRRRDSAAIRADVTVNEKVSLGATAEYHDNSYGDTQIGLNSGHGFDLGFDVAVALSEQTQISGYVQAQKARSTVAGSTQAAAPNWTASDQDRFEVLGLNVKHAFVANKLDVGADLSVARSRSNRLVQVSISDPSFPTAKTARDTLKLFASYKISPSITLDGSIWHERYDAQDWSLDGITPAALSDLLALGLAAPRYEINALRLNLRYRF